MEIHVDFAQAAMESWLHHCMYMYCRVVYVSFHDLIELMYSFRS
jgi:hypothetical protein